MVPAFKIAITLTSKNKVAFEGGATIPATLKIARDNFFAHKGVKVIEIFTREDELVDRFIRTKKGFAVDLSKLQEPVQLELFPLDPIMKNPKTENNGFELKTNGRIKIPSSRIHSINRGSRSNDERRDLPGKVGKRTTAK